MHISRALFAQHGLRLSRFRAGPSEAVRRHRHASAHLFFLLDGGLAQRVGRREVELIASTARLSGADARHDIDFGADGGACVVIHFRAPHLAGSHFFSAQDAAVHATALSAQLGNPAHAPLAFLEAAFAVTRMSGDASALPDWLHHARALLLSPEGPSVAHVGRQIGVSREHLARAFRASFGVSPQQTRRCARGARAAGAIVSGAAPAAQLAIEAGYADQSHLIREFHALFGMTPHQFALQSGSQKSNPGASVSA